MNLEPVHVLPLPAAGKVRPLRLYLLEAKYELLKALRMPGFTVPSLGFPVLFYCLFGVSLGARQSVGPVTLATYLLATYGTFGVAGSALFAFGVGVAVERGQGWMLLKRATPMPPMAYFAAKLAVSALFGATIVVLLGLVGTLMAGVRLPASTWLALGGVLVAGALPFGALGLLLGSLCGPNSAAPVTNLVYLSMSFLSGLWMPIEMLPRPVQAVAPLLPTYHQAQLALWTLGSGRGGPALVHVAALAGFTVAFLLAALALFRRGEGKSYG